VRLSAEPSLARPQLPRSTRWSRLRPPTTDSQHNHYPLILKYCTDSIIISDR